MKIPNDIHENSTKIPWNPQWYAWKFPKKIPPKNSPMISLMKAPLAPSLGALGQATPRWLAKDVVRQVQMLHAVAQTQHRSAAVGARWAGVARVETHDLSAKIDEMEKEPSMDTLW